MPRFKQLREFNRGAKSESRKALSKIKKIEKLIDGNQLLEPFEIRKLESKIEELSRKVLK